MTNLLIALGIVALNVVFFLILLKRFSAPAPKQDDKAMSLLLEQMNDLSRTVDRKMAENEPTIEDTKKLMQADLFHTELVTPEELALRHSRSIGRNFEVFTRRARSEEGAGGSGATPAVPQWQRMLDLKIPVLLIYGREDRAHAGERAELFKKSHPQVNLHILDGCKHMVPWDKEQDVYRLAIPFIKSA